MTSVELKGRRKKEVTMKHADPQAEHRWLAKFLGEWELVGEADMGPGQEPHVTTGEESVRSLGGFWVIAEGKGVMPDGRNAEMLMALGYDPVTARFIGSWIGSMMTHQWMYQGDLDDDNHELTLYAEGPDLSGTGTLAMYKDVYTFESDDQRVLRSYIQETEGKWRRFMKVRYRRKR